MTTLTKYQPALTYVPSFDVTEVTTQRLYVVTGKLSKNQYVRQCMGTSPEEVLYTIILFRNTSSNMGQKATDKETHPNFLTVLRPSPRSVYSELVDDKNADDETEAVDPFNGVYANAIRAFIARIVEDPQAKESTLAAFGDGKSFVKPADKSVKDHYERVVALCNYVLTFSQGQEPTS